MVITTRPPESATEGEQDSTSHQPPPLPQSWMKTIRVSAAPRQGDRSCPCAKSQLRVQMECGILFPVYPHWLPHLLLRGQDSSWQGRVTPGFMYLPARTGGLLLSQLFHLDQQACSLTPYRCSAERKARSLSLSPLLSLSLFLSLSLRPSVSSLFFLSLFLLLCPPLFSVSASLCVHLSVCLSISLSIFPYREALERVSILGAGVMLPHCLKHSPET